MRDDRERSLRAIYGEVLGRAGRSGSGRRGDVLSSLGGHSLKAVAALSAIYKRTGIQLKFSEFLEHSTVAEVAHTLAMRARAGAVADETWETAPADRALPLTSSQQRIFAVQQLSTWTTAYNIPFAWELGADVDLARLERALGELIARHHALRAEFVVDATTGVAQQRFRDDAKLVVEHIQIDDANLRVTLDRFVRPFDLAIAPLVRAAIVRSPSRTVLALDVHHIVADGLSVRVLLEDLEAIYGDKPHATSARCHRRRSPTTCGGRRATPVAHTARPSARGGSSASPRRRARSSCRATLIARRA